ncbi:MAG: PH domain-containing protein [Actinomycetota bacterium]
MAQTGTPSTSSLFRPLGPTGVLIKGERIKYNERRHWAILIRPFLETLAVLTFVTMFAGGVPTGVFGVIVIGSSTLMLFVQARRNDWSQALVYGVVAGLLIGFTAFGVTGMAILAILVAAGRFIYTAAMWAFYERLYITNRRVIASAGFLGARIDTMPLTRVTDINYRTTVLGELLGYGVLRVETAGQDQALSLLEFLDKPNNFYEILIDLSTAAVGSVTENEEVPEDLGLGVLDEDDGSGTLLP